MEAHYPVDQPLPERCTVPEWPSEDSLRDLANANSPTGAAGLFGGFLLVAAVLFALAYFFLNDPHCLKRESLGWCLENNRSVARNIYGMAGLFGAAFAFLGWNRYLSHIRVPAVIQAFRRKSDVVWVFRENWVERGTRRLDRAWIVLARADGSRRRWAATDKVVEDARRYFTDATFGYSEEKDRQFRQRPASMRKAPSGDGAQRVSVRDRSQL